MSNLRRLVRPTQYAERINLALRRSWFTDNPTPPATPPAGDADKSKTPAPAGDKPNDAAVSDSTKPDSFSRDYVEELRKENAKHRTAAREAQEKLDKIEADKKKAADKELADQNNYKALADQRENELKEERLKFQQERVTLLKGNIAGRYESRLPKSDKPEIDPVAEFAKRLQGTTEEEIKADAERLIALFGIKPATETATPQTPANPQARRQTTAVAPGGQPAGETDAERRARLYKQGAQNTPLFKRPTD